MCSGPGLLICQMPNSRRSAKPPPSGLRVCAHSHWGGGESAEIPACVRGQGHRQAAAICCPLERPVQGPSILEGRPSLSPGLLVFAGSFHSYRLVSPSHLPCQISILSPFYRRRNGGSEKGSDSLKVITASKRGSWRLSAHSASPSQPQP